MRIMSRSIAVPILFIASLLAAAGFPRSLRAGELSEAAALAKEYLQRTEPLKAATAIVAVSLAVAPGRQACCGDNGSPLRIADGLFDLSDTTTLGLKTISGEHVELYHATEEIRYRFSHHPGVSVFEGHIYCSWSSGYAHEDRPGQRVLFARSANGKDWSQPRVLTEPDADHDRCIAAGFHVCGDTLVAYYTVCREYPTHNLYHPDNAVFARTSHDGQSWSEPRKVASGFFIEGPRRLPGGRLLLAGESVGELWKTHRVRMRLLYSDDPTGLTGWKEAAIDPSRTDPKGTQVFGYTEPCPFARRDGVIVSPFRNTSGFLYASISQDNGVSWSVPQKTDFPDSRSRFCTGRLPDGRIYLINNPGPGLDRRTGIGNRSLLTIALSNDGIVFDRAWLIRGEPTTHRFHGKGKADGWQYPNALVWGNELHVAYSVNKEDVMLTRISLKDLK